MRLSDAHELDRRVVDVRGPVDGQAEVLRLGEVLVGESHLGPPLVVSLVSRTLGARTPAHMGQTPHLRRMRGLRVEGDLWGFGQQAVLDREQARRHPAGGTDLRVDVLDVVAGGLG